MKAAGGMPLTFRRERIISLSLTMAIIAALGAMLFCAPVYAADRSDFQGSLSSLESADASLTRVVREAAPRIKAAVAKKAARSADIGLSFDEDVPEATRRQMANDLAFVESIKGSGASPLLRKIFGAVDGPSYRRFFSSRVRSVGMSAPAPAEMLAAVDPEKAPGQMLLNRSYVDSEMPEIQRVAIMFHEARHLEDERDHWAHAVCPGVLTDLDGRRWDTNLGGKRGCDTTPIGGYGLSLVMLRNIERYCENCSGKAILDAGLFADTISTRIADDDARQALRDDFSTFSR
jgi:hypothetical protein